MKLIAAAGLLSLSIFSNNIAQAEPVNQAALTAAQIATVTVEQAQTLKDDSKVVLTGQIVRAVDHEKYEFKDATGSIVVEIDDKKWKGQPIDPNTTLTLLGKVNKDHFNKQKVEIDVDEVRY